VTAGEDQATLPGTQGTPSAVGVPVAAAWARATAVAAGLVADPSAVDAVVAAVGWSVRPRRSPDALRRAIRDRADGSVDATGVGITDVARSAVGADDLRAATELLERWCRLGCRLAVVGTSGYPTSLAEGWPDTDAPLVLASRGEPHPDGPSVALVGARRATGYGVGVTSWLAESASAAGVRVVSGGAVGIDAAAHRAALDRPGGTTVVLGCGHGVGYPRPHAQVGGLFPAVLEAGGTLVSELFPDVAATPWTVRARNRIVAGLAEVTVVVEGGERSGALLTATAAAGRGRAVLAVPGDVRAPGSIAPHRLLLDGAAPCTGPEDLLAWLGAHLDAPSEHHVDAERRPVAPSTLPTELLGPLRAAWPRPLRVEDLAAASGVAPAAVLAAVTRARVAGELADGPDGVRLRRAPS
jgi:DNA processing protein